MASVFTSIIEGSIPGRFVYADDQCVVFLTIAPRTPGHAMVVPRQEFDQWIDLPSPLANHLFSVAQIIGAAQRDEFGAVRIGLLIEGYEVAHTHLHVWPSHSPEDFSTEAVNHEPDSEALDEAAQRLYERLVIRGVSEASRSL